MTKLEKQFTQELERHVVENYILLCKVLSEQYKKNQASHLVWKCKKDIEKDNPKTFTLGIGIQKGQQITQRIPIARWTEIDCKELQHIVNYDGHTREDVIQRLTKLLK